MRKILFYILLFFSISTYAQFEEHFTDGGFNVNPHWDTLGSTFIVVNQVLNFQGVNNSGKAAMVTEDNVGPSAQWEFYLRLGFQPTDTDNVKIVLGSDDQELRGDFNGYFLKIGKNGTNDGLDFYRKDGANETLIKSMLSAQFISGADANFKIVKNNLGKWLFYWKNNGQTDYTVIDSLRESTYYSSSYFGMICNYTSASKDSFWLDDVYSVRLPLVSTDTIPPNVVRAELINSHHIDVYFDEVLDVASAQTIANYTLSVLNNPTTAVLDAANKKLVHLYYSARFSSNTTYSLTTNFVKDSVGNAMTVPHVGLINTPYYAIAGDVIVNEIMVKPPVTGLPNKQYVELRNNSNESIRLKDWKLNNRNLYDGYLAPNGYVILCPAADTVGFKVLGNTVGVSNWSALGFSGAATIRTDDDILMDSLPYVDETYQDPVKQLGGWSMELDSQRYAGNCPKDLFWSASNNSLGGTPGKLNSKGFSTRYIHATDSLLNSTSIEINFHAPMGPDEVESISNYTIDNGASIQSVVALNGYASKAKVSFTTPLLENTIYTLIIRQFSACIGYVHAADTFKIAITQVPEEGELIINEVLFHPNASGEQFVELYNKTNKLFKIKDLIIAQADAVSGIENQTLNLQNTSGFIFPNDYLLLSKNKNSIKAQYNATVLSKCIDVNLPALDTKEDIVVLKNSENEAIDKLHYYEDWHFPLITTKQGVSLERTSFDAATQLKRNWHSAAPEVLATPGYLNSENSYELQGDVHIIPEVFSPDGDGVDDVATITYSFDDAGSTVNVYLFNTDGRLANHLVKDVTIPKEGVFLWNGDDENGEKKDVGIYFLVFERKQTDGTKLIYKRRCVLAAKLN